MTKIEPRTLKGFRDFLPAQMRVRRRVFETFRTVFEKFGYEPLETPTLEYADILMGKYGSEAEQLIYKFTDRGGRDVAMRYDVTVPACRVMAQYKNDLPLPFKRYQIQPVWRADNTQKGRFREFYQCDADTFGTKSQLAEAEFIQMGIEVLLELGFTGIDVRINNRKIIDGMLSFAGVTQEQFYTACVAIDKMDKIGLQGVQEELKTKGIEEEVISNIAEFLTDSLEDKLASLENKLGDMPQAQEGITELRTLFSMLETAGVPVGTYRFDIAIIRGLSYYTGPIFEFEIKDGGVGSIGSGGRYDNLVELYSGDSVPAAGGSFGIERLIEIITDRNMMSDTSAMSTLLAPLGENAQKKALELAGKMRNNGKTVMVYPDSDTKLEKMMKYADKKKIMKVIIIGENELASSIATVKNMETGDTSNIPFSELSK